MKHLVLEPITADGFAPFGQLLLPPLPGQPRFDVIDELQNGRPGAKARLSLAVLEPATLPLVASRMERHVQSSQAFVPTDCASYLVLVAPHAPGSDRPDARKLRAFQVPGDTGINYRADTWHYPLTALERTARFVVLTFVDGSVGDEEFVPLSEDVTISG